jgi:hypothetical protein
MTSIEKNIIKHLKDLHGVNIDVSRNAFVFPDVTNELTIIEIKKATINVEANEIDKMEIDLSELPFNTFFDEADFISRITRNSWNKSIFIFKENIFYSIIDGRTYISNILTDNHFLVSNNFYCYKFLEFLKTQEHQDNSAFYFVDYLNWDTYHLVLTSLKKDGKLEILLPKKGVDIRSDIKLSSAVSEFINAFDENNRHFPKFIKTELISNLSQVEKGKRLEALLRNLNEIIYVASQNFEIYIHDLSLENLKKDFIEHKNKYFIQLRDILSKLTNQILGLPIVIGASVFSTYKVSDSNSTLLIILGVFFLYSFYSVFLLKLQKEDIQDIKLSFQTDFTKIQGSQFFLKFPDELKEFGKAKGNLDLRIKSLITAIDLYFLFFSLSTIAFVLYVENQLKISTTGMVWTALAVALGFLVVYILNQTLSKESK